MNSSLSVEENLRCVVVRASPIIQGDLPPFPLALPHDLVCDLGTWSLLVYPI
jgi:hypothetical protein